jgi:hypothetical protein
LHGQWIENLRTRPEATNFIQDLLDIIANHMLVIEKKDRATANELLPMFNDIKEKFGQNGQNVSYYIDPSTSSGSAVAQVPAPQTLNREALESIRSASRAIPRFTGQTRSGGTHLGP